VRVVAAVLLLACDRGASSSSVSASAADASATEPGRVASGGPADAAEPTTLGDAGAEDGFTDARPLKGKPIGHTSVVFKIGFEGGLDAAYKPRSRRGKDRYKGEVAAYRLGLALGLPNVPRAIPRSFPLAKLRDAFGATPAAVELLDREAVAEPDGTLRGALIPWIPKLEFLPLESVEWRRRWQPWLSGAGTVADSDRALAAQISTMIVFDWLTGNWDRWSGANIGIDRATDTLLYVDNDGAFFDPPPPKPLAEQLASLRKVARFSARLTDALGKLDRPALAAAIGEERPGAPLLCEHVLDAVDQRRRVALEHMRAVAARPPPGPAFL
jgi:hypothetical protein